MTKTQALYNFFNSYGIPAYPLSSVPSDVVFPYMTYEVITANNMQTTNPTVTLWYYTDSEAIPNAKADEIAKDLMLGNSISCEDGAIYIYFSSAWQGISDENNSSIKGRTTTLTVVFNTL